MIIAYSRRTSMRHIALGLTAWVAGCGDDGSPAGESDGGSTTGDDGATGPGSSSSTGNGSSATGAGSTDDDTSSGGPDEESSSSAAVDESSSTGEPPACIATPEATEGPFWIDLDLVRQDITEGRPGMPLAIEITVIDVNGGCMPIEGAAVDIWHTDAAGTYSGFAVKGTEGETFLRGIQMTDARGIARFTSIYPGWYMGRTTHIHVKIVLGPTTVLTSQIYFPDDVTAAVYETPPYDVDGPADTTNVDDAFFAPENLAEVVPEGDGYRLAMTIGVMG